jgi:hypothetical protein
MGRSLKKGPFVADSLLSKIEKLNAKGEKKSLKPGRGLQQFCRRWSVIRSPFITVASTSRSLFPNKWSVTNLANLRPRARSGDTPKATKKLGDAKRPFVTGATVGLGLTQRESKHYGSQHTSRS